MKFGTAKYLVKKFSLNTTEQIIPLTIFLETTVVKITIITKNSNEQHRLRSALHEILQPTLSQILLLTEVTIF